MPNETTTRPGLEAQRQKIVEAAFAVLGRRALEDTRVEDVLREAGVSRQTFYRAFPDLDTLFAEVYRQIERFLTDGLGARLDAPKTPQDWLRSYIDSVIDAAVAAGPAILAIEREEKRRGSPFYGATAKRQAAQAELVTVWSRTSFGLKADAWQVMAVFAACRELCLRVADPASREEGDVARAKEAGWALAEGLLLRCGARQGLWSVKPRSAAAAALLPRDSKKEGT